MKKKAYKPTTLHKAVADVDPAIRNAVGDLLCGGDLPGANWQHAVTIAVAITEAVFAELTPGYPFTGVIESMGHSVAVYFANRPPEEQEPAD